jgi:hypothetical protein
MTPNTHEFTDWFPSNVKPVRDGVYRVHRIANRPLYARYTNGVWWLVHASIAEARRSRVTSGVQQSRGADWRMILLQS